MKKVVTERKDIVFFIKMFPLPIHKNAYEMAKTIVCEKSLQLLENAFQGKQLPKPKCKSTAVDDNIALGKKIGVNGAPTLIMPDGRIVAGFKDANALKAEIDRKTTP
jgi:thiol:disulfide interchange protein DsbC